VVSALFASLNLAATISGHPLLPFAIAWLLTPLAALQLVCVGRQFLLVRTRFIAGNIVAIFWIFAAGVVVGFLGWNFAWLGAGMALFFLTMSFVVAHSPARMDYSLFQRAANGLLKEDDADREAQGPPAGTANERFRFARFLGERYLVIDWRTTPDTLRLRVADMTLSVWAQFFPGFWRSPSTLELKHDGEVSAHLGKADQLELMGLDGPTATEADRLETTVARSVRQAWAAYARGDTARAEAVLGEEASRAVFLKDPAEAAFAQTNVWMMRIGVILMAAGAIFFARVYQEKLRGELAHRAIELTQPEVRARLNAIVGQSATTTERFETLEELWFMSPILPSREWFTPAMLTVIDAQIRRGLAKSGQPDPNHAALDDSLFQKAVVWDLVRNEDLARFGVSRDGVRRAIAQLPDEERRALTTQLKRTTDWASRAELHRLSCRLQFLERMNCLDLLDLTPMVASLLALQVGPARPLTEPLFVGYPPADGLFVSRSIYSARQDTYQALTVLRIAGALDQIDREACIQGILRLHQYRNRVPDVYLIDDAKDTYCSYESLRILKAVDRVHDWPSWPRWLAVHHFMPLERAPHWQNTQREEETLEAWLLRREFERKIAGGKGGAGDAGRLERPDRRLRGALLQVPVGGPELLHSQQLHFKDQPRVGRNDAAGAARPVAQGRGDQEQPLATHLHRGHALVPSRDHLADTAGELEWLAPIDRAVEFLSLLPILPEPPSVMHRAGLPRAGHLSLARHHVLVAQAAVGRRHLGRVDRVLGPRHCGGGRQAGSGDYKSAHPHAGSPVAGVGGGEMPSARRRR